MKPKKNVYAHHRQQFRCQSILGISAIQSNFWLHILPLITSPTALAYLMVCYGMLMSNTCGRAICCVPHEHLFQINAGISALHRENFSYVNTTWSWKNICLTVWTVEIITVDVSSTASEYFHLKDIYFKRFSTHPSTGLFEALTKRKQSVC